jgi:hypothetical protein
MAIILRHQDALDGAAVGGKFQQVTNGAVDGVKTLIDGEPAMGHFGAETLPKFFREFLSLLEIRNVALIESVINLTGAKGPGAWTEQVKKLGDVQSE